MVAATSNRQLLRFLTCGSVDDGKSTLIGRMLYDSKLLFDDQLDSLLSNRSEQSTSADSLPDFASLVDGLQAEREQGITIDVAYRYFGTRSRQFIIADTPGHERYTRNMVTGASHCDAAVLLIDARHGLRLQTQRHGFVVSLLGIRDVIVAVNKMDQVGFSAQRFGEIEEEYRRFSDNLPSHRLHFVPLSALHGDNLVQPSAHMSWYRGEPLLSLLEGIEPAQRVASKQLRLPVQYVSRSARHGRIYCGSLAAGRLRCGDRVTILPSGEQSRIVHILDGEKSLPEASAPQAVAVTIADERDISQGDILVDAVAAPALHDRIEATLVWMDSTPLHCNKRYIFRFAAAESKGCVSAVHCQIDPCDMAEKPAVQLPFNGIGRCRIELEQGVVCDDYQDIPSTGCFIMIDSNSYATVAAGLVTVSKSSQTALAGGSQRQPLIDCRLPAACLPLLDGVQKTLKAEGYPLVVLRADRLPVALQSHSDSLFTWLQEEGLLPFRVFLETAEKTVSLAINGASIGRFPASAERLSEVLLAALRQHGNR